MAIGILASVKHRCMGDMTVSRLTSGPVVSGYRRGRNLAVALALTSAVSVAVMPSVAAGARESAVITYSVTHVKSAPPITVVKITNRAMTTLTGIETHIALGYGLPEQVLPASTCTTHTEKFSCSLNVASGATTTICVQGSEIPVREGLYVKYANGTTEINEPELAGVATSCPLGSFGGASKCVVPNVKGKKLGPATSALKGAHCAVGRITKVHSTHVRKGRVIAESPAAGRSLPSGAKVSLTLSKGG
jgi:PASTA domain